MLPDTGERYLSTPLFDDVAVENDRGGARTVAVDAGIPLRCHPGGRHRRRWKRQDALDEAATREVDAMLRDPDRPVVMFAFEWCEFCSSVRKVFAKYGIAYTSIDLDSVAYQQGDRGGKIFEVLKRRTGSVTLPQIFIGGDFEGGCTDVFDSLKSGQLHTRLQKHGVSFDPSVRTDPYELLPKWLHPR